MTLRDLPFLVRGATARASGAKVRWYDTRDPLIVLANTIDACLAAARPNAGVYLMDPAYESGILRGICTAADIWNIDFTNVWVPQVPLAVLHKEERRLVVRLRRSARLGADMDLGAYLKRFECGVVAHHERAARRFAA